MPESSMRTDRWIFSYLQSPSLLGHHAVCLTVDPVWSILSESSSAPSSPNNPSVRSGSQLDASACDVFQNKTSARAERQFSQSKREYVAIFFVNNAMNRKSVLLQATFVLISLKRKLPCVYFETLCDSFCNDFDIFRICSLGYCCYFTLKWTLCRHETNNKTTARVWES